MLLDLISIIDHEIWLSILNNLNELRIHHQTVFELKTIIIIQQTVAQHFRLNHQAHENSTNLF